MLRGIARDESRGGGAGARAGHRDRGVPHQPRIGRQPEIVVRAEVDRFAAIGLNDRASPSGYGAEMSFEAALTKCRELGGQYILERGDGERVR